MTHWMRLLLFAVVLATTGACEVGTADPGDGMGDGMGNGMGGGDGNNDDGDGSDPDFDAPTDGSFLSVCTPGDPDSCMADYFCFEFNNKGPHCSTECVEDADCPEPSAGCNGKGVCKVP